MDWFNWGDVPTWAATIGAFVAAYFAFKAFSMERRRDQVAEDLRSRAQADRIAVWREVGMPPGGYDYSLEFAVIRNASDLPVYDVKLWSYSFTGFTGEPTNMDPDGIFEYPVQPPSDAPDRRLAYDDHSKGWHWAMQFRDAAGNVWHRDLAGVLKPGPYPAVGEFTRQHFEDPDA